MSRYKIERMLNPLYKNTNDVIYVAFKKFLFSWKLVSRIEPTSLKAVKKHRCNYLYRNIFKESSSATLKGAERKIQNYIWYRAFELKKELRRKRREKEVSKRWDIPPFGNGE